MGLPEEVFLRIEVLPAPRESPLPEAEEAPAADQKGEAGDREESAPPERPRLGIRQHLFKPQYIDFRNPLLVDLFSRMTANLDYFTLTFEERLPGAEHLIRSGEDGYATELLLQR